MLGVGWLCWFVCVGPWVPSVAEIPGGWLGVCDACLGLVVSSVPWVAVALAMSRTIYHWFGIVRDLVFDPSGLLSLAKGS